MGYDTSRFVSLGDLEDDLTCSICYGIYAEPVVTPCGHTFCRECVVRWFDQERSCPSCRKSCHKLCRPPVIITKLVGRQKLRCEYEGRGCHQVVELDQLPAHLAACDQKPRANPIRAFFKNIFNFAPSAVSNYFSETAVEYDGERVDEPNMVGGSRFRSDLGRNLNMAPNSVRVEMQDARAVIIKLVVLCFLLIFGIFSVKAILWTYSVLGHVAEATVGLTGLTIFQILKQVLEKLVIAAISFAVSLVFIFFTSTFFALYNY